MTYVNYKIWDIDGCRWTDSNLNLWVLGVGYGIVGQCYSQSIESRILQDGRSVQVSLSEGALWYDSVYMTTVRLGYE